MEFLSRYLGHLERKFNSPSKVGHIGFLPHKTDWIQRTFDTCNFSFIVEGTGWYNYRDRKIRVAAPCVIIQWPGEPMNYGPDTEWFEVYLIYSEQFFDYFTQRGFIKESRPHWNIASKDWLIDAVGELSALVANEKRLDPDLVDMHCERLILASLLGRPSEAPTSRIERSIRKIAAQVQDNFLEVIDGEEAAKQCGLSLSSFRRHWLKYLKVPPAAYRSRLLMQEACRLLAETDLPISEIAVLLNFDDALYFSKKFHKEIGLPPTSYRQQNRRLPI
jgi:AraC-like DNA-binding protein